MFIAASSINGAIKSLFKYFAIIAGTILYWLDSLAILSGAAKCLSGYLTPGTVDECDCLFFLTAKHGEAICRFGEQKMLSARKHSDMQCLGLIVSGYKITKQK